MSCRNEGVSSYVSTKVNIGIIHFIFKIPEKLNFTYNTTDIMKRGCT